MAVLSHRQHLLSILWPLPNYWHDKFCFGLIEHEEILSHPESDVLNAILKLLHGLVGFTYGKWKVQLSKVNVTLCFLAIATRALCSLRPKGPNLVPYLMQRIAGLLRAGYDYDISLICYLRHVQWRKSNNNDNSKNTVFYRCICDTMLFVWHVILVLCYS